MNLYFEKFRITSSELLSYFVKREYSSMVRDACRIIDRIVAITTRAMREHNNSRFFFFLRKINSSME